MSARRQARARQDPRRVIETAGGVPSCLLIGRCIEVWASDDDGWPYGSAIRRFNTVRDWWQQHHGLAAEDDAGVPTGAPWSVEYLTYRGQAERVGRPLRELVLERLNRGGADRTDLPTLRNEADDLYAMAAGPSRRTQRKAA